MENPSTWKRAELVISDALDEHHEMTKAGACGPSVMHHVADELRRAGLLDDAEQPEIGWEGLRAHREVG